MARDVRSAEAAWAALERQPGWGPALAAVAAHPGAWVVGGAARDALLGRAPRELDVVVEGDPEPLAAALGDLVEAHERFGTRTLQVSGGPRVDLVRARAETYAAPGALPEVRAGTLEEDLARRDLTINALALGWGGPTPQGRSSTPRVRAVAGAIEDLRAGVVRVLHDGSFADDPTRLWRVARYATRLGCAVAAATASLAAAADPTTASGPRHGGELRLTLAEADPAATLAATAALAPALFPAGFRADPARDALAVLPPGEGRPGLVVLAASCAGVDAAALVAWLRALAVPAADADVVAAGSRTAVLAPLRTATRPSEAARAARGAPVEVVALAGGPWAAWWLAEGRHVALALRGDDLLAAGVPAGPEVGRRLARALDARLDGLAATRQDELRAALD